MKKNNQNNKIVIFDNDGTIGHFLGYYVEAGLCTRDSHKEIYPEYLKEPFFRENIFNLLDYLKFQNINLALATGAPKKYLDILLNKFEAEYNRFDQVYHGYQLGFDAKENRKKDYSIIFEDFKIIPDTSNNIVIGDHIHDKPKTHGVFIHQPFGYKFDANCLKHRIDWVFQLKV